MRRRWSVCARGSRVLLWFVTWAAICIPVPAFAQSETLTLVWDRNPEPDIDHYNVYVGSRPGTADVVHVVHASENGFTFTMAPGQIAYYSVSAVNAEGVEGLRSSELACALPTLGQPADQSGVVGTAVAQLVLQANDPAGGLLTFQAAGLPSGVTINSATGVIKGIPTTAGTWLVTVSADNGVVIARRSFTWTIVPSLTSPSLNTVSVSPDSGSGSSGTFTAVYSDSYGAVDLSIVYLKFSTTSTGPSNTCMVSYSPADRQLSLRDDSGSVWQSATIGWGTLQNSQCSVNLAASAASSNGLTLSLTVSMVFKAAYAGAKNVYSYATSRTSVNTGWKTMGTWTIPVDTVSLSSVSVVPNAGLGARQTFTAQFTDALGVGDIAFAYVKFATGAIGASNSCMVRYDGASRTLSLRDDAGMWLPGGAPGVGSMQQNTQCSVDIRNSAVTLSGQTLTVTVALGFSAAYAGDKNIYLYASSVGGTVTDWQWRGSWTIPVEGEDAHTVGAVTPNAGFGITQTFSAQYFDGVNDPVSLAYLKFSETSLGPQNTCMVHYDRFARLLSLRDDAGIWQPGVPFSAGGSQQNSQCIISMAESSASVVAGVLTLNMRVTFAPSYAGPKNIYLYATGTTGRVTDWQQRGTWEVP
jgi:Putative Ig domain